MYFRDPKKELPEAHSRVLLKLNCGGYAIALTGPDYISWHDDMELYFLDDIAGWMSISELDLIEIK